MYDKQRSGAASPGTILFAALGLCTLLAVCLLPLRFLPAEDALILFQYSRNLAHSGVISFIPGGVRAEGATDFLWMAYFAAGMALRLPESILLGLANLVCFLGICLALLRLAGRKASPVAVLVTASLFFFFPQPLAAIKGFSVLAFGFALTMLVLFCEEDRDIAAGVTALIMCLLRPDGIVFALPLLIRSLWRSPHSNRLWTYVACFVIPGAIYFAWRWHYFGQLFPLPFYVKSDPGTLSARLVSAVAGIAPYVLFATVISYIILWHRAVNTRTVSLLFAIGVVPTLFYCCMRLDQNVGDRFYFYLVLLPAILLAVTWKHGAVMPRSRAGLTVGVLAYVLCISPFMAKALAFAVGDEQRNDVLRVIASQMNQPGLKGSVLTTEAGIIPYYSHWTAYDPWGLNTLEYAKRLIRPEDIVAVHPDVIVVHTRTGTPQSCELVSRAPQSTRSWDNMVQNIDTGVSESGNYQVWVLPGRVTLVDKVVHHALSKDTGAFCWYISDVYPGKERMVKLLTSQGAVKLG